MSSNESAQSTKPQDALASPFMRPTTAWLLCFGAGRLLAGAGMRIVLGPDASLKDAADMAPGVHQVGLDQTSRIQGCPAYILHPPSVSPLTNRREILGREVGPHDK